MVRATCRVDTKPATLGAGCSSLLPAEASASSSLSCRQTNASLQSGHFCRRRHVCDEVAALSLHMPP